ncbi:MAG: LysR family transcriptional regulator [Dehalococcoidia bacterium]
MELGQLEAFVKVVETGNFSRAAGTLHITQPSLSARILGLERELGGPLFHRIGRGVRLTELGRAFLPYVERALETLNSGRETLSSIRSASRGKLHIGSARVICTYVLPEMLERFRERHPGVEVSIRTGRSTEVLEMVLSGEVDMGFARALVHPQVRSLHLYDEHIVLVTHPSHPFAATRQASIYDVAYEPLILYDRDSTYFVLIDRICRDAGIVPTIEMELDSVEATKRMIEQGLGISFLPRNSIRSELSAGSLVEVAIKEKHQVALPTALILRKTQGYGVLVNAFLETLREQFPLEPVSRSALAAGA